MTLCLLRRLVGERDKTPERSALGTKLLLFHKEKVRSNSDLPLQPFYKAETAASHGERHAGQRVVLDEGLDLLEVSDRALAVVAGPGSGLHLLDVALGLVGGRTVSRRRRESARRPNSRCCNPGCRKTGSIGQ